MTDNRPTFLFKNQPKRFIRAGGFIYYRVNDYNEPEFLMIKYRGRYEDFGGKTDACDTCIEDTVAREADEESNGIFKKKEILRILKKKVGTYCRHSKYIVYICKSNKNFNPEDFGEREYHDNIPRTVEWIPYKKLIDKDFIKQNLHIRLRFKYFFRRINNINNFLQTQ